MTNYFLLTMLIISGLFLSSCDNKNNQKNEEKVRKDIAIKIAEVDSTNYVEQSVDDELADNIKKFITTKFLTQADLRAISDNQRKFQFYKIDLNNDGNEEVFVNFMTPYFCGTGGCTVLLLNSNIELITRFSPVQSVYVEETMKNEWKNLWSNTGGEWRELVYENGTYPSNPTLIEGINKKPEGKIILIFDQDSRNLKTYTF